MVEDYPNLNPAMLIESWQDLFNCHIDPLALGFELHSLCVHLEERQVLGREVYRIYILIKFLECTHSESYFFQELHVELKGFLVGPSYSLEVEWILLNLRVNCAISKFNRYYPEYIVLHHITLHYIIIIIIVILQQVDIDFWQLRHTKTKAHLDFWQGNIRNVDAEEDEVVPLGPSYWGSQRHGLGWLAEIWNNWTSYWGSQRISDWMVDEGEIWIVFFTELNALNCSPLLTPISSFWAKELHLVDLLTVTFLLLTSDGINLAENKRHGLGWLAEI